MTPSDCISQVDSIKHNTVPTSMKYVWLSELNLRAIIELLNTHTLSAEEQAEVDGFEPYSAGSGSPVTLLIPDPFSEIYRYWLMAKIDEVNREMASYSNNIAQYNQAWTVYANWYNRTHMPLMRISHFRLDGGNIWTPTDPLS